MSGSAVLPQRQGQPLLHTVDLGIQSRIAATQRTIVTGVNLAVHAGETVGIVGESGSGKSMTARALVGLLPAGLTARGEVRLRGRNLLAAPERELSRVRGGEIALILQDPMASLNPLFSIEDPVAEPAHYHRGMSGTQLRERVRSLLQAVRIPSPEVRMREYPHQMSGGMRQRAVGAIALSGGPELIIADEPTTNLDVTIQAQYLNMLKDLQRRTGVALLFITHNLGIVAKMCDKVAVMYGGRIVEQGPVRELFKAPRHPYTQALLRSVPRIGSKEPLYAIPGQPPDLANLPIGCAFHPRCPHAMERCRAEEPIDFALSDDHRARCWLLDADVQRSMVNGQRSDSTLNVERVTGGGDARGS